VPDRVTGTHTQGKHSPGAAVAGDPGVSNRPLACAVAEAALLQRLICANMSMREQAPKSCDAVWKPSRTTLAFYTAPLVSRAHTTRLKREYWNA
jgi:hypothetical protein